MPEPEVVQGMQFSRVSSDGDQGHSIYLDHKGIGPQRFFFFLSSFAKKWGPLSVTA